MLAVVPLDNNLGLGYIVSQTDLGFLKGSKGLGETRQRFIHGVRIFMNGSAGLYTLSCLFHEL